MIGAIAGDIIGSAYEHAPIKTKEFPLFHPLCRFTDDSVLTAGVALAILTNRPYIEVLWEMGRRYPSAGYGSSFLAWLHCSDPKPYNSWGNGAAMRVSPVGFAFADEEEVLLQAAKSAEISHNHPEGIKGAQATALAVYLAGNGSSKEAIRTVIAERFGYDLQHRVDDIRPWYSFDISCQGSVPQALIAFFDSDSYEDAVRNAVSLGGDSDTLACITGGIAEAFYGGLPAEILEGVQGYLSTELWEICTAFRQKYGEKK
ncbi:MAG: ADP-ribosylglycohydrolase family protein [Desulfopila sp.]|jgi:ADP-ribosylglycohydrolase|nr:ADP-ribosylglycohydrolase family protein [Desulfopila sp.]